jgi:hypothetical protein
VELQPRMSMDGTGHASVQRDVPSHSPVHPPSTAASGRLMISPQPGHTAIADDRRATPALMLTRL